MKASAVLLFLMITIAGHAQNTNINNYKYVLVPEKFDFSKFEDQYGLNSTTKLLLEQKGFVTFVTNETLPPALAANKCLALRAIVTQRNGLFVTRLTLMLKDCQDNIIFKSKEGKSSEKEFPAAFDGALRDAFTSLNTVAYKYDSTAAAPLQQIAPQQTTSPQQSTQPQPVAVTPTAPSSTPATTTPPAPVPAKPAAGELTGTLYAQPTPNGYQLIDTTPKKVLTLLKTSVQDYFIADAGGNNGIVFKRNGEWFFERYEDNKLVSQKLDIKF